METLKEVVVDAALIFAAWLIVTAGGVYERGMSCGGNRNQIHTEASKP